MILLFTSDKCAWCEVLKKMLEEEAEDLGLLESIYEVNVDHLHHIAEAYKGKFSLVVEGAIPMGADGKYCIIGELDHKEITMMVKGDIGKFR